MLRPEVAGGVSAVMLRISGPGKLNPIFGDFSRLRIGGLWCFGKSLDTCRHLAGLGKIQLLTLGCVNCKESWVACDVVVCTQPALVTGFNWF